jgi:hypothetical protein
MVSDFCGLIQSKPFGVTYFEVCHSDQMDADELCFCWLQSIECYGLILGLWSKTVSCKYFEMDPAIHLRGMPV